MRLSVYLPLNSQIGKLDSEQIIHKFTTEITKLFNGSSLYPNAIYGFWLNPKTKAIEKDTTSLLEVYLTREDLNAKRTELGYLLHLVKSQLKQESLAYTIDNDIFFL